MGSGLLKRGTYDLLVLWIGGSLLSATLWEVFLKDKIAAWKAARNG